jgi:hypothetical protein
VPEPEFMSTYRFLFALMAYPIYYLLIVLLLGSLLGYIVALAIATGVFLFNLIYVKQ